MQRHEYFLWVGRAVRTRFVVRIAGAGLSGTPRLGCGADAGLSDIDADGMEDTWETTHLGGLSQGPLDDHDRDGSSNLTEFRLGLDPGDGSSAFAVSLGAGGMLVWPSTEGVTFTVQRSDSLDSWNDIATVSGMAGTASFADPAPQANKAFYRIRLEP